MSDLSVSRGGWRPRAVPLRLRSDDRLARDAATGDTAAFALLYERHHQPLYRYCRSIVANPDDAADALQSTMTRALASIGERNPGAPVRAWLFRIAHNESISVIRRRRSSEPLDGQTLVAPDVAADAEGRRRLADLVQDLQGLSERQRGALLMREISGLGHAEIAAALGATEGAVKQSIYEARVALQELAVGREMSCSAVRRELSDGDGRSARARRMRGHLRSCEDCRRFRDALRTRRSELALIAPLLPAAAAADVLDAVIGAAGGIGGGGLLAGLLGSSAAKTVAVGAATVTAGAGAASYTVLAPDADRRQSRAAKTIERDVAARAAERPKAQPVLAVSDSKPGRDDDGPTLASVKRSADGDDRRGAPPADEDRDDDHDRGSARRERENDDRDREKDDREDEADDGHDDSKTSSSGRSGHEPEHDDEPEDDDADDQERDSSGPGSGDEAETAERVKTPKPVETPEPEEPDDD